MARIYEFDLPYPPSLNHYYRNVRGRTLISAEGRRYRARVKACLVGSIPLRNRLRVIVRVCPPDRRRRDLDNVLKALLDALQHARAYEDDGQIDHLDVRRGPIVKGGRILLTIEPLKTVGENV